MIQRPIFMTAQNMCGMQPPCRGCQDRKYDCHFKGHCKKYDAYKESVEKYKNSAEYRQYLREHGIDRRLENV